MNIFKYESICCLMIILFCFCSRNTAVYGIDAGIEQEISSSILQKIFEGEIIIKPLIQSDEKTSSFHDPIKQVRGYVYGSRDYDINGDGENEAIIGCEFAKSTKELRDFLAIYSFIEGGKPIQIFHKEFDWIDQGMFDKFYFQDTTGDELPELIVEYNFASAGANSAGWEQYFYLIQTSPPFQTLLELKVWEGWQSNSGKSDYVKNSEWSIQDRDGDAIFEISVTKFEGENQFEMKQVTSSPLTYHATFTLTTYSFDHLRQQGFHEDIATQLRVLQDRIFLSKQAFLQEVEQQIGAEAAQQYGAWLVQSAIGPYQVSRP